MKISTINLKKLIKEELFYREFYCGKTINEEKRKLLKEITPGAAGIAAMGGGTPADQGFAAAAAEEPRKTARRAQGPIEVRGILEDLLIPALLEEGLQGWDVVDTLRAAADLMENEWSLGER